MKKCVLCNLPTIKVMSKYCKECDKAIRDEYNLIVKTAWGKAIKRRVKNLAKNSD